MRKPMSLVARPTCGSMAAKPRPIHAVMFTSTVAGAHARYTWELMCAMRGSASPSEFRLSLVTSENLDPEFHQAEYRIFEVLPPLRPRASFPTKLHWAMSRVDHFRRRDSLYFRFLRDLGGVDIVHYQEEPFLSPFHYPRLRRLGIHPVETVHNLLPHRSLVRGTGWLSQRISTAGWGRCSALFVHSDGLRDQLLRRLSGRAPPIISIPHGMWRVPRRFQWTSEDRLKRKQLLLFGTLRRNKGIDVMLDALRYLPGAQLTLAGVFEQSSVRNQVVARLQDQTLPVRLIDRFISEDEVASLYGEATLAVLPYTTNFHAQSGVLHLAISHGVPVVVTDVGALGEFVREKRVGTVAPPNDGAAFAEAIQRALEPSTYDELRQSCDRLSSSLSWKDAARLTLGCYEDVLRAQEIARSPTA